MLLDFIGRDEDKQYFITNKINNPPPWLKERKSTLTYIGAPSFASVRANEGGARGAHLLQLPFILIAVIFALSYYQVVNQFNIKQIARIL